MTFKLDPSWAGSPLQVTIVGKFTVVNNITAVNTQIVPAVINSFTPGTSNLNSVSTVSPLSNKVVVFANPNGTLAGATGNTAVLPRGLVTSTTATPGSEFVLDLNAFPGEIVTADAAAVPYGRGTRAVEAVVNAIDHSNSLVYINIVNYQTGALSTTPANFSVAFKVFVKDTTGV